MVPFKLLPSDRSRELTLPEAVAAFSCENESNAALFAETAEFKEPILELSCEPIELVLRKAELSPLPTSVFNELVKLLSPVFTVLEMLESHPAIL